jgi:hypothetical protein
MFGDRSFVLAATCVFIGALASLRPAAVQAQTIDLSLNVFYTTPSNINSGGTWELVAKSSNFGISGLDAHLRDIATALNRAPRATVNGNDSAGFSVYADATFPTYRGLIFGQAPVFPFMPGDEQGVFYGVGQLANGAPNYPGKPPGSNSEGPAFTSLTAPLEIPWATGDAFSNPAWNTAALLASGTFALNVTPSFVEGSAGAVFTTLGTSNTFPDPTAATVSAIVRTNFAPSADYNHNGFVDAADYVLWRETKNQSVTPGTGADGSNNGTIDQPDYDLWRANFGNAAGAGSGGSLSTNAVPEPFSAFLLALGAMLVYAATRTIRPIPAHALLHVPTSVRSSTQPLHVASNPAIKN